MTTLLKSTAGLGYKQFRCCNCASQFNERTGTIYNFLEFPTDIVMLTVFYYYHFKNSLVDVTKHMALRGISLSHETVRLWSQKIGTDAALKFRSRRRGKCGKKWHMDITYLKIKGYDAYLYRAIDKTGNLIDIYLSDKRDKKAAEAFFRSCEKTTAVHPVQITTEKEPAFVDAIKNALGNDVKHRDSKYMNNRMEQNYRGTKSRTRLMKGFKESWCAMIFCHTFEEIRQFFYMPNKTTAERRRLFVPKFQQFNKIANQAI
ncbi:MAG: IS6 family transposase [Gammaproteobacteria bacterium]|nr:IS6 family transposase [Gammaproteobacteria bacterium]